MDSYVTYGWLLLSSLAAGILNSIAGGGTLLTFPALLAVVSPVVANATSTVALVPGSLAGAWGYRRELRESAAWASLLFWPSILGGALGALLVSRLDERYFDLLIPWLILTAAVLFLLQPLMTRLVRIRPADQAPGKRSIALVLIFQFLVAIYGGYFGAGIGILMLSALGLMGMGDIHRMNALKTLLAACINAVAVAVFVLEAKVNWGYALSMAVAAVIGGYVGARAARRLNRNLVRWVVIVIGFGLAAHFFYRSFSRPPRPPAESQHQTMIMSPSLESASRSS